MKIILFYFEIYSNLNNYLDQVCQNPFYNEHGYYQTMQVKMFISF